MSDRERAQKEMRALLNAGRRVRGGFRHWLRGAATHVLAELLQELEKDGWRLAAYNAALQGGDQRGSDDPTPDDRHGFDLSDNRVDGFPEWTIGIVIRAGDGTVRFDLSNERTGQVIEGVISSSSYRRTDTAKLMEGEQAIGYEAVARRAIEEAIAPPTQAPERVVPQDARVTVGLSRIGPDSGRVHRRAGPVNDVEAEAINAAYDVMLDDTDLPDDFEAAKRMALAAISARPPVPQDDEREDVQ